MINDILIYYVNLKSNELIYFTKLKFCNLFILDRILEKVNKKLQFSICFFKYRNTRLNTNFFAISKISFKNIDRPFPR